MRRHDPDALTPREREVLALIRLGLTNEEIARRLGITLDGAKYHVSQILSKLGVATREEAAGIAQAVEPRPRAWWARWPLWAKIAGAATVAAAVAGLAALAWGSWRTEGGPSSQADDQASFNAAELTAEQLTPASTPDCPLGWEARTSASAFVNFCTPPGWLSEEALGPPPGALQFDYFGAVYVPPADDSLDTRAFPGGRGIITELRPPDVASPHISYRTGIQFARLSSESPHRPPLDFCEMTKEVAIDAFPVLLCPLPPGELGTDVAYYIAEFGEPYGSLWIRLSINPEESRQHVKQLLAIRDSIRFDPRGVPTA